MLRSSFHTLPGTLLLFLMFAVLLPCLLTPLAAPASSGSAPDDPGAPEDQVKGPVEADEGGPMDGDDPTSEGDPDDYDRWISPTMCWVLKVYLLFVL